MEALILVATLGGPTMFARIGIMRFEPPCGTRVRHVKEGQALGPAEIGEGPMTTVWIYVDTNHYVGHPDQLKVFATRKPPVCGALLDMRDLAQ